MKRKCLVIILLVIFITSCGKKVEERKIEGRSKCDVLECINIINVDDSIEKMDEVIGFKGEKTDDELKTYMWRLNDQIVLKAVYYLDGNATLKLEFPLKLLKNDKVDFTNYTKLQSKVDIGIDYKEFKSYVNNQDGIVIEKTFLFTKYQWIDKDLNNIIATFSNETGKCTYIKGTIIK